MNLLIIAGFLGSGKTTLLLHLARRLASASRKIVIIENEMGEVGIDGDYLTREGLHVQNLFGGCICCTLSSGLINTLDKVEQLYEPDLAILEATGAARPGDITANLQRYRKGMGIMRVITLVDASRHEMLMEMMSPLVTAQVQAADVVVVNKSDQVAPKTLERVVGSVGPLNPQARVIPLSAEDKTEVNRLMGDLL